MRVKPVDPTMIIRDPHTKRPLPAEGGDVPETNFWTRRVLSGEVVRIDEELVPVGSDPIAPLNTRGHRR